jgi:hypothetical protein
MPLIMSHGSATPSHSLPASITSRNSSALRSLDPCPTQERQMSWLHFTSSMLPGCQLISFPLQIVGTDCRSLLRYTPISEQDFKEQVFSLFYESNSTAEQDPLEAHKLALMFFVFALGKLTDPRTRDLSTQESMKYFHIGRAALTLNQSLETPSVPLLQALLLMCHFMFLANIESSRWLTMGIVVKLSQSVSFLQSLVLCVRVLKDVPQIGLREFRLRHIYGEGLRVDMAS